MMRTGILPEERLSESHWNMREIRILEQLYPAGGSPACRAAGVRRSSHAIRHRAHLLNLKRSSAK